MEKIAFIIGETFIYWSSIILTLAVVTAICIFAFFYLKNLRNAIAWAIFLPASIVVSLYLSRFLHWYCLTDSYSSMESAMGDFSRGGFALMGVFFGCFAVACVLRLVRIVKSLPELLDCLALGGAAGIAVGRLASIFNGTARGMAVEGITALPWVYPMTNAVSGAVEYRLATFMLQAMATGLIFLILAIFYLKGTGKNGTLRSGDTACLFLCFYGASQVVLDSTRYDSLFMRSNGFISIVQILGAAALILTMIYFSVRMVKARRFKWWYISLWLVYAGCAGGAGYMEYWVQRHGDQAIFSYSVMTGCLVVMLILTCVVRLLAVKHERKLKNPL
jgi:prolipoprotein diacylglyceryltransferase